MEDFKIKNATRNDSGTILKFIKLLAEYENLSDEVSVTVEDLIDNLLSEDSSAEAIIGYKNSKPIAFAVFFHNFSTFLGKKGLYLEDIFVLPEFRGKGYGKKMLRFLAKLAIERDCGRFEWSVLDWNKPAIDFYVSIGAELKKEWIITRLSHSSLEKFVNQ